MLADETTEGASGSLTKTLHKPAAWLETIVAFIYSQLPAWRDDPRRQVESAEPKLTAQLCRFLNDVIRLSHLDSISFQTEVPDPVALGRTLDLAPFPHGCVIWIGGRRHILYDLILPIECKRLPTPTGKRREKREYLHTQKGVKGGVQRFKAGKHGAAHDVGVMIGYVENQCVSGWLSRLNRWILVLTRAGIAGWTAGDLLSNRAHDSLGRVSHNFSDNDRVGLTPIALHHLWVDMKTTLEKQSDANIRGKVIG